jgi:tetratricopeptide (TPR) repeat protein
MFYLLIILCLWSVQPAIAAGQADGGLPGYFMNQGAGARALAMGRTFVAIADDVSAIYWNPAGLAQVPKKELQLMNVPLFDDTVYNFIGYAHSMLKPWTVGIGIMQLQSGGFTRRDDYNTPGDTFSGQDQAVLVSAGYDLSDFYIGCTAKSVSNKLDTFSSTGFGMDVGLLSKLGSGFSLGINLQNVIGAKIQRDYIADETPMTIRPGIAWTSDDKTYKVALDIDNTANQSIKPHFGIEYCPNNVFAFRAGYDNGNLTAGIGISPKDFSIDYAIVNHTDLGTGHRVSAGFKFGMSKIETVQKYVQDGDIAFNSDKLNDALKQYNDALKINSNDEAAISGIEKVKNKINALTQEGDAAYAFEKWHVAYTKFGELLQLDPDNLDLKQKYEKAKTRVEEVDTHFNKAIENLNSGDWDNAELEFTEITNREKLDRTEEFNTKKDDLIKWLKNIRKLAVMPLEPKEVSAMDADQTTNDLRERIINSISFKFVVVERAEIEKVMKEEKIQNAICSDKACVTKIGKKTGAFQAIFGEVSPNTLSVRVVEIEPGIINWEKSNKSFKLEFEIKDDNKKEAVFNEIVKSLVEYQKTAEQTKITDEIKRLKGYLKQ